MEREEPQPATTSDLRRMLEELAAAQAAPDEDGAPPADEGVPPPKDDGLVPTPQFRRWVGELPCPTPAEIVAQLRELGYLGQDRGARAMALAAFRHVRRIKSLHLDGIARGDLPDKQNLLLVGPTGCGKTYLVELLFGRVLGIPTATVDATAYSETGYIGEDVTSMLTRLLYAAGGDPLKTRVGMICLDEFDKLASANNRAVFAGEGTTKDVSGLGVQRELLKMLEACVVAVPTRIGHDTYQDRPLLYTGDIAFVACGAFSGLKGVSHRRHGGGIGFHAPGQVQPDEIAVHYDQAEMDDTVIFQQYGFLPELIGRFSRIVPFDPLPRATLLDILRRNVLRVYRREFELAQIELTVEEPVLDALVDEALRKQTGARGLRSALILHLEEAAFEAYSAGNVHRILLERRDGQVVSRVEK